MFGSSLVLSAMGFTDAQLPALRSDMETMADILLDLYFHEREQRHNSFECDTSLDNPFHEKWFESRGGQKAC